MDAAAALDVSPAMHAAQKPSPSSRSDQGWLHPQAKHSTSSSCTAGAATQGSDAEAELPVACSEACAAGCQLGAAEKAVLPPSVPPEPIHTDGAGPSAVVFPF